MIRWFADWYLKWVVYDFFTLYLRADGQLFGSTSNFMTLRQQRCTKIVKPEDAVFFPNRWSACGLFWLEMLDSLTPGRQAHAKVEQARLRGERKNPRQVSEENKHSNITKRRPFLLKNRGRKRVEKSRESPWRLRRNDGALAKWQRCHNTTLLEMMVKHAKCKDM